MRFLPISIVVLTIFLGACSSMKHTDVTNVTDVREVQVLPGTRTALNGIYMRGGKPQVQYETVVLHNNQRVVFAGPDEFIIKFKEGSVFEDSNDNEPGTYRSRNGIIILEVSPDKTAELKESKRFKYSVFVKDIELDPFIYWKKDN